MNSKIVAGVVVAIILLSALAAILASRFESYAWIGDVDMKLENVNESHAAISLLVEVRKKNINSFTLEAKIYEYQTDLLLDRIQEEFESADSDYEAVLTLPLEKTRDYRVELRLMQGENVFDSRQLTIRNLRSLIPESVKLDASMVGADFLLTNATNDSVRFKARFYVESVKDYDVTARMKVVHTESNVLVDESWMNLTLKRGKTNIIEATFDVPNGYNYIVKLELWRNGKLVKVWKDAIKLAPTKVIPKDIEEEKVDFDVQKFIKDEVPSADMRAGAGMPGFEAVPAAMAVLGAAVWRKMRS